MSKKIVVVGGDDNLAKAVAGLLNDRKLGDYKLFEKVEDVETNIAGTDGKVLFLDEMVFAKLNSHELQVIAEHEMLDMARHTYGLRRSEPMQFPKEEYSDDLPTNTTKPKFLMERDHHIRSPRGRR